MNGHSRKQTGRRPAATLFDDATFAGDEFQERVRAFGREVARRHQRDRGDLNCMLVALRGWHRAWHAASTGGVAPLDDAAIAIAIAAYEAGGGRRGRTAAA